MFCCRICANSEGNLSFTVREMMFGFRDKFEYYQCARCGCLQIEEIPKNIAKYYPHSYYSFNMNKDGFVKTAYTKGKQYLEHQIAKQSLGQENIIGKMLARKYSSFTWPEWLKIAKVKLDSAILDVGCGSGGLLLDMYRVGFSNLTGIDPYLEQDTYYKNKVSILKRSLSEVTEQYDFIMLNHAFEHMEDPLPALKNIHRLLYSNQFVLIRMPVAQCHAWEIYGVNWYQLDAPRHFFLHTRKSMELLAAQAGFTVSSIVYDSTGTQFWRSEGYVQDITLIEQLKSPPFSKRERNRFDEKAKVLNQEGRGDQACFFLQKI
jgi:2-polyprenyl-3-methyl-5-hydroxy-6-metoxy-1,4-benzoquinol methylase